MLFIFCHNKIHVVYRYQGLTPRDSYGVVLGAARVLELYSHSSLSNVQPHARQGPGRNINE